MSNDMASTDPTPASAGERLRKAVELRDEIYKKLAQAQGICGVIHGARDMALIEESIRDSMWAATELIEQAQTAFKELKEVQS